MKTIHFSQILIQHFDFAFVHNRRAVYSDNPKDRSVHRHRLHHKAFAVTTCSQVESAFIVDAQRLAQPFRLYTERSQDVADDSPESDERSEEIKASRSAKLTRSEASTISALSSQSICKHVAFVHDVIHRNHRASHASITLRALDTNGHPFALKKHTVNIRHQHSRITLKTSISITMTAS